MAIDREKYLEILAGLGSGVQLVAVSKTKPAEDILELYQLGQRDFGENYVQELTDKQAQLPAAIRWHFIGHLQSNKVKYIAPFVSLIQGVDSFKLLSEIDKQAGKNQRIIDVLLQVHIAREETKYGLDETELAGLMKILEDGGLHNVRVRGLMGMASFANDPSIAREEFRGLKELFDKYNAAGSPAGSKPGFVAPAILSMGMSDDYRAAVEEGTNMVRIGSLLFGKRG